MLSGGEIGSYDAVAQMLLPSDFIVCADSGYLHAQQLGIKADAVLGDFDSCPRDKVDCGCVVQYPSKKDFTDTELCVRYAIERGCDEILLLAATGGRIDHELANVFLLKVILDAGIRGSIFDGVSQTWLVDREIEFDDAQPGDLLSVLPITPQVGGISTKGLEYPLHGADLAFGPALGISNVFVDRHASVRIEDGLILVVRTKKASLQP